MRVRTHQPPTFRIWVKQTLTTLLLLAVLPSLFGAAVIARHASTIATLDVNPTPRVVLHESR
jgi:hypothetical protein